MLSDLRISFRVSSTSICLSLIASTLHGTSPGIVPPTETSCGRLLGSLKVMTAWLPTRPEYANVDVGSGDAASWNGIFADQSFVGCDADLTSTSLGPAAAMADGGIVALMIVAPIRWDGIGWPPKSTCA